MNRTAKEMTTLPLTLLQELVKEAAAKLPKANPCVYPLSEHWCVEVSKVYHRNHVKRYIEVYLWENGTVLAGYSFTDKRIGHSVCRSMLVRSRRWNLKVGVLGDGGFTPDWQNIRKLEGEMEWGYWLALTGKLK